MVKLGQTDSGQNMNVRLFGGTDVLGLGHNVILVRLILVIATQGVGQANLVGPIRSSRWDRSITKRK